MIKKIILIITAVILLSFTAINNFRELVLNKITKYSDNYPEKIYIQTDKPYYSIGDDIWYTVYLVNGISHKRTDKSRVIYVELINEQDSIISKNQLYTNDISVAGDFKIQKNLNSGNYMIRGYTNYMRNQNSDFFFQKELQVLDAAKSTEIKKSFIKTANTQNTNDSILTTKPNIKFYPEGGNLVNGLFCKVAIEVKDKRDRNIAIQGTIMESNGEALQNFKTQDFGLTVITLTPEPNKNYYASVIINNQEYKYPLPKALPKGYNLSIIQFGDEVIIKALSNLPTGLLNTYLVGHLRGNLIFEKMETTNTEAYTVKFNIALLPQGVSNFTLFDNKGRPVCERLIFIGNSTNDINVNLSIEKTLPTTREKISFDLDLNDREGNQLTGNLSLSITDIDAIEHNTTFENIKTYLLLNSDLRGSIENPGYFFEKGNDYKRRYLLDLVMLTKGWRRFTWTDLLYDNSGRHKKHKSEVGIFISGKTKALKGAKEKISAATRITLMSRLPHQDKMQSDHKGHFNYGPFIFSDSIPALLEARVKGFRSDDDDKNRNVSIFLDKPNYNSPKVTKQNMLKSHFKDSTKINNFINQTKNIAAIDSIYINQSTLLDEVLITARRNTEEDKRRSELNERTMYGSASNRIDISQMENQRHMRLMDLLNMLPGVTAFNETISIRNSGTPKILMDGFEVELEDVLFMTGNDVDFIDVLKGADASIFSNSGNGVIAIYTRTGDFYRNINIKRQPGIIDFTAIGFYTAREFYAPNHLNDSDDALKRDIRTTLHWEPKIVLSEESPKATISFFTSDIKSNYGIKIEGITTRGIPFCHLSTLEVD